VCCAAKLFLTLIISVCGILLKGGTTIIADVYTLIAY
jgi:hypothetical protein